MLNEDFLKKKIKPKNKKEQSDNQSESPDFSQVDNQQESIVDPQETNSANEKLKSELESLKSQYLRLAADFDNFRKRKEQERKDTIKYGALTTAENLLPVLDTLDRALVSFKEVDDLTKLKESFEVFYRQFNESMCKIKLIKIKTLGEQFDPQYHEAVMQEETTDYTDGEIMMELQSGYMLDDKVIRPSMVKVASNSSSVAQEANNAEG